MTFPITFSNVLTPHGPWRSGVAQTSVRKGGAEGGRSRRDPDPVSLTPSFAAQTPPFTRPTLFF